MTIPVATALGRRDRSWPAILASATVHAAVIAWALTAASRPELTLDQKPIVAKLVRLGQKRPDELLPRKSSTAPPPAPAAPAPPAPVPAAAPAPAAPAPVAPAAKPAPASRPALAAKPPPPAPPAHASGSTARGSGASVASILAGARRAQEHDQEQWGSPDGDPMGDADQAAEGDRYLAQVVQALRQNYSVPEMLSDRDRLSLEAKVVLYIESDGRVARWNVEAPSGNGLFDGALERTLSRTRRVPPPPEGSRDQYRRGILVIFTPRTLG